MGYEKGLKWLIFVETVDSVLGLTLHVNLYHDLACHEEPVGFGWSLINNVLGLGRWI